MRRFRFSVALVPLFAFVVFACGSSGSNAGPDASAGDGGDQLDAAPPVDAEQDPNVFPAKHHPLPLMVDRGGPITFSPHLVPVNFANDPMNVQIASFTAALPNGTWWKAVATPYHVDPPTVEAPYELPDTLSGKTLDDVQQFQPYVQQQVMAGALPPPDAGTIYVFFVPSTTTISDRNGFTTCQQIGGYHDAVTVTAPGVPATAVPYAVVARCSADFDQLTFAATHEILEAVMSSQPAKLPGWYMLGDDPWTGPGGGEMADVCEGRGPIAADGALVARAWSNDAAKSGKDPCQPARADRLYFQAALDTQSAPVTSAFGSYMSDGFVIVPRGATRTFTGTFFSEAALPHDVDLYVGLPMSSTDPTQLGPIAAGVTATLSRQTAHNGNAFTVTISVAPSAKPGDYGFDVRSVLTTSDVHSWPVFLRIM